MILKKIRSNGVKSLKTRFDESDLMRFREAGGDQGDLLHWLAPRLAPMK